MDEYEQWKRRVRRERIAGDIIFWGITGGCLLAVIYTFGRYISYIR